MKRYLLVLLFPVLMKGHLFAQQSQNSISVQGRLSSTATVSGVQVEIFANGISVSTASPIDMMPDQNGVFTAYITGFNSTVFQIPAGLFEIGFKKDNVEIAKTPLTTVAFALAVRGINAGGNILGVSGNVGIGTTEPEKKLTVAGDVLIDGDLYARNLVGAVMFFAGPTCPTGWRLANGDVLSSTGTFAALFNYLKYTYGQVGENFVLPNMLDGSFIRSTGGNAAAQGTKQFDAFQGHKMDTYDNGNILYGSGTSATGWGTGRNMSFNLTASGDTITTQLNSDGHGSPRTDVETRPRNYAMTPCIKY